jgi:hypothetical protein
VNKVKPIVYSKERSLSPVAHVAAPALGVPVNKARPNDILKQSDCQSFVRKINKEKRERQARMDEIRRREDNKLNAELEMNREKEAYKLAQKELQVSRKQE